MVSDRRVLREGMREGDLGDLVLPLISVDEYESKIDKDAVVFGFYVEDSGAADDLNRFMQKSAVSILDTEISPSPDKDGYYICFVEMLDNKRLASGIKTLLDEIGPLVGLDEWQIRVRKAKKVVPFSEDTLVSLLAKARDNETAEMLEFLQPSELLSARLVENVLSLYGTNERHDFNVEAFGSLDRIVHSYSLNECAIRLDLRSVAFCNRLGKLLGEGWNASMMADHVLLQRADSSKSILLRALDT